jgi:hypothetical protein
MGRFTLSRSGRRGIRLSVGWGPVHPPNPQALRAFHADLRKLISKHKLKAKPAAKKRK